MLTRRKRKFVIIVISFLLMNGFTVTSWGTTGESSCADCASEVPCAPSTSCGTCTTYTLTLTAGTGGNVLPWTGTYAICRGTAVSVIASAKSCYRFAGWTGTAVTAGAVVHPQDPSVTLIMNDNYTMEAHFVEDAPIIQTLPAEVVTPTQFKLRGNVLDPRLWNYQLRFRYRRLGQSTWQTTDWCGPLIPALSSSLYSQTVTVASSGTYEYVFEAKNMCGSSLGEILTVSTGSTPTPTPTPDCTVIYVDDNAAYDPAPGDFTISDPAENGSATHPFDSIQEAIEAATDCSTILVRSGVYTESIDLMGKGLTLKGAWLVGKDLCVKAIPILRSDHSGAVVSCINGETAATTIAGLMIAGSPAGPGILIQNASPTITHCVVAGNRGPGIKAINSQSVVQFCTVVGNRSTEAEGGLDLWNTSVTLSHSIVWGNTLNIYVRFGNNPVVSYSDVEGGWPESSTAMDLEPGFVDPGTWHTAGTPLDLEDDFWIQGDYHLMSQTGRYWPTYDRWVTDPLDSLMIDAGDPTFNASAEPQPNGNVVNIGAYGNTSQASLSAM